MDLQRHLLQCSFRRFHRSSQGILLRVLLLQLSIGNHRRVELISSVAVELRRSKRPRTPSRDQLQPRPQSLLLQQQQLRRHREDQVQLRQRTRHREIMERTEVLESRQPHNQPNNVFECSTTSLLAQETMRDYRREKEMF